VTAREELFRRTAEIVGALAHVLERFAYDDVGAFEQAEIVRCVAAFRFAAQSAGRVADACKKDGQPC
jgi:hypothetical protein